VGEENTMTLSQQSDHPAIFLVCIDCWGDYAGPISETEASDDVCYLDQEDVEVVGNESRHTLQKIRIYYFTMIIRDSQ